MVRFAALATLLCGCAQIFGLDETSGRPPPSLTIQRASIGSSVVYAPQDLSTSIGAYLVADAAGITRVPVTQAELGRWTSTITRPAPLLFDLPDFPRPILRLFDFPEPEVKALFGVLEHPSPEPAPPGATLSVNVTLNSPHVAGERYELFIVGAWASAAIAAPVAGATAFSQNLASTAFGSLTGRPLERITAADSPLVLRYATNELRGALRATPLEQLPVAAPKAVPAAIPPITAVPDPVPDLRSSTPAQSAAKPGTATTSTTTTTSDTHTEDADAHAEADTTDEEH